MRSPARWVKSAFFAVWVWDGRGRRAEAAADVQSGGGGRLVVAEVGVVRWEGTARVLGPKVVCFSMLRDGTAGLKLGTREAVGRRTRGTVVESGKRQHVSSVPRITKRGARRVSRLNGVYSWPCASRHQPTRDPGASVVYPRLLRTPVVCSAQRPVCTFLSACQSGPAPGSRPIALANTSRSHAGGDDAFCYCAQTASAKRGVGRRIAGSTPRVDDEARSSQPLTH